MLRGNAKIWRNRLASAVVSLALSFCLWLGLAGQDMNIVDLSVPLELSNLPDDLALRSEVPGSVTVQVLANTAQVRFLADRKLHLWANVASAREGSNTFQLNTNSLDLPRGVQVRKISPADINFVTIKVSERLVPLTPAVRGAPAPAYQVGSLTLEPDQVTVRGPEEVLKNIAALTTEPIGLEGLTKDAVIAVNSNLSPYGEAKLTVSPLEIKANVKIEERLDTATFSNLPIDVDFKSGFVDSQELTIFPERAEVSVSWPATRDRPPEAGEIKARIFLDLESLKKSRPASLPVVVVPPSGVTVTAIKPVSVMVTYTPKEGPVPSGRPGN